MSEHGSRRAAPSSRGSRGRRSASAGGFGDKLSDLAGSLSSRFPRRGGADDGDAYGDDGYETVRSGPGGGGSRGRGRSSGQTRPPKSSAPPPKDWWMRFVDYPRYGKRGWRHWMPSIKQILAMFMAFVFSVIGLVSWAYANTTVPSTAHFIANDKPTQFTFDDGTKFATIGLSYYPVTDIKQIPDVVQNAVIAAEDKSFKSNSGVSFTGVARSALSDIFGSGGSTQGASTITQQYVKNAYLTQDRTFSRKINEVLISIKLSHNENKDQILLGYLNQISFGRGAYGIDAASRLYLGEPVGDIGTPKDKGNPDAEAAFLATLINNPSVFANALKNQAARLSHKGSMDELMKRYNQVLANMRNYNLAPAASVDPLQGKLPTVLDEAQDTGETLSGYNGYMKESATAYLAKMVQQYPNDVNTQKFANIDNLSKGGYTVITTYNRAMMDDSIQAANTGFWNAGDWKPTNTKHLSDKDVHLAFASVNPLNGFVESFYNGVDGVEDYTKYPFNAALDGGIQVGSTFKPITLATALDSGQFSLDSTEPGSNSKPLYVKPGSTNPKDKLTYVDQYGKTQNWPPNEDDESGGVNGMATLTQGMAMSLNSVFAALEMDPTIGPDKVLTKAKQMGINADPADFKAVPSLTLGVSSVTPMRMASAYSTFAANGVHREPIQVQKILDSTGKTVWTPPAVANQSITQAMQTNTAAGVTQALQEVLKTGTASQNPAASKFAAKVNYNVAGKTGTTDYNHSAWFNGFSSNLATAVAMYRQTPSGILESLKGVGSSDTTARVNGNSYPTSVWAAFMALEASRHPNLFAKPFPAYTPNCTGVSALTNLGQPVAAGPPAPSSAASGAQYQNYPGSTGPTCQGVLPPTPTTTTTTTTSAPPPPPPPTTPDCQRDPNNLACVSTPSAPTDTPSMPTPSDTLTTPSTTPSGVATTPGSRYCKQNPFAPSCATTSPSSSQTSPLSTP